MDVFQWDGNIAHFLWDFIHFSDVLLILQMHYSHKWDKVGMVNKQKLSNDTIITANDKVTTER